MITVHHLNRSRSKRILWLLEELGMSYNLVEHQRDPVTHLAPESLKQVHPLAKAPIIVDGDITLCESGVIMEYILDKASKSQQTTGQQNTLRPNQSAPNYYQYLEWMYFAEGSLALPVIASVMMKMEERSGSMPMDGYIGKEVNLDFSYIDKTLEQNDYFAGEEFTAADIMMAIILEMAEPYGLLENRLNIQAFLKRVQQRTAYQKILSFN